MESIFIFPLLLFLVAPVLAIMALVQISNLSTRVAGLKRDIEKLTAGESLPKAVVRAATTILPVRTVEPIAEIQTGAAAPISDIPVKEESRAKAAPPRDMENALASRWFVWIGGAAVALGGLLFVKYAHDNGLIPPLLQVIVGLAFGSVLVAAGEWLRKRGDAMALSHVPAALSAAGLAISFGVIYAAYALYDIFSPAICFPLLVAIGLGALWLSRRQGPLIAALGLLGSYAAPALVPSDNPSAFGFFAYLLVIVTASLFELRSRPWWWLGFAALAGAGLWALLWIQGSLFQPTDTLPAAVFALLAGAAATLVPRGRGILAAEMGTLADPAISVAWPMRLAIAGLALSSVVLAALVWSSDYSTLALLFFATGMLAITSFGWLRDGMVAAPIAAAVATFLVLMAWPEVGFHELAMDERGFWSTVPGKLEPFRFRNAMYLALGVFTAIGLSGIFQHGEKRPWSVLAAGSAVLFLFGTWARADTVQSTTNWLALALLLAVILAVVADRVRGRAAEILMAGVALLLLFAVDRAFDGVWQTLAIACLGAAFAFATRRLVLPWLGGIATGVATLAAARLFFGRDFWGEPAGLPLGRHWLLYGYGVPALLFWQASRWLTGDMFARHRVALEGLALGLAISLVSLELRVLIAGGVTARGVSLLELSAHALAWLGAAYGLAYRQTLFSSFVSLWGARVLLAAAAIAFLFALTLLNPALTGDVIEGSAIFNSLWLAYLAPVALFALMARKLEGLGLATLRNGFGAFALALLLAFVTLETMRLFQGPWLTDHFTSDAESYAVSAAWIATAIAIFIFGIWLQRQTIRLGGLAILVLAVLKVFVLDLFQLGGLWRIASIIGLGLCLIGVGWLYTRFVQRPKSAGTT